MNLKKIKSGFTVVELMIVIVVIAILATISVVTYSGMQDRAKNSLIASSVAQYKKAILSYRTFNSGASPLDDGIRYVCLGTVADYPTEGSCGIPYHSAKGDANFEAAMRSMIDELPEVDDRCFAWGSEACRRNAVFFARPLDDQNPINFQVDGVSHHSYIMYYVTGNDCGNKVLGMTTWPNFTKANSNKYTELNGNTALCMIEMPDF